VPAAVAAATALLIGLAGTTAAAGTATRRLAPVPAVDGPVTATDVTTLEAELDRAARAADAAAAEVFQAASRATSLRIATEDAEVRRLEAQDALEHRVREFYMTGQPDPVVSMFLGLYGGDLTTLARAGLRSDAELLAAVERDADAVAKLRNRADAERQALVKRAQRVFELQDRARRLLAAAESAYAGNHAKLAELAERRAKLDEQSQDVSHAATPAVTARGRRAAAAEAPIIAALEAAGSAFPPGFRRTGQRLNGEASWYGPGFVGNPTATGAPYDPERFTAAMLAVPLGTVVRVTTADGHAVNVLINDRGPYAHHRIIDMSAAGARMLDFTGVKQVTVEVLEPIR